MPTRLGCLLLPWLLLFAACKERPPSGKPAPAAARLTSKRAEKIQALPYLATAPIPEEEKRKVGVTLHREGEAAAGLTVFCSEETDSILWIDLAGEVRRSLRVPGEKCKQVKPVAGGDLLLLGDGTLSRLGPDGEPRWRRVAQYEPTEPGRQASFHHDMDVTARGEVYALTNNNRLVLHRGKKIPIRDDEITVLGKGGKRRRSHSLFDLLRKGWVPEKRLDAILAAVEARGLAGVGWDDLTDLLHVNTLEVLERGTPFGRPGQVLICSRYLDLVALLDLARRKVIWSWGPGQLQWPHHPTVLPNGNLLIFDNGSRRKWSRVLELDPRTNEVVWQYGAAKGERRFFTDTRGSAQRLPGGTVLITESDRGRVFEVTRAGERVWEYFNPALVEVDGKTERRLIYRAMRVPSEK